MVVCNSASASAQTVLPKTIFVDVFILVSVIFFERVRVSATALPRQTVVLLNG